MSHEFNSFFLPFDPFTPSAAPAKPWLDACTCATDAMTAWARHWVGATAAPGSYARLGWLTLQAMQPWIAQTWLSPSDSRVPRPTSLKPGLSPADATLDQWREQTGIALAQIRGCVDESLDAWFAGMKFVAGTLATASPYLGDNAPSIAEAAQATRDRRPGATPKTAPQSNASA